MKPKSFPGVQLVGSKNYCPSIGWKMLKESSTEPPPLQQLVKSMGNPVDLPFSTSPLIWRLSPSSPNMRIFGYSEYGQLSRFYSHCLPIQYIQIISSWYSHYVTHHYRIHETIYSSILFRWYIHIISCPRSPHENPDFVSMISPVDLLNDAGNATCSL